MGQTETLRERWRICCVAEMLESFVGNDGGREMFFKPLEVVISDCNSVTIFNGMLQKKPQKCKNMQVFKKKYS
ncbi:MAG: hypothetical protein IJY72_00595 [Akkermansia sp.]|nr:hypothetical protein [Akkermansia sp.]